VPVTKHADPSLQSITSATPLLARNMHAVERVRAAVEVLGPARCVLGRAVEACLRLVVAGAEAGRRVVVRAAVGCSRCVVRARVVATRTVVVLVARLAVVFGRGVVAVRPLVVRGLVWALVLSVVAIRVVILRVVMMRVVGALVDRVVDPSSAKCVSIASDGVRQHQRRKQNKNLREACTMQGSHSHNMCAHHTAAAHPDHGTVLRRRNRSNNHRHIHAQHT
jgi:hypothetical protein